MINVCNQPLSSLLFGILPYLTEQLFLILKSWPFIILVIVLVFKKPLEDIMGRIKEVEAIGTKFSIIQPSITAESLTGSNLSTITTENAEKNKFVSLPAEEGPFKIVVEEKEKIIKDIVEKMPYNNEEILIRALSSTSLALEYEKIYEYIFKSQIDALLRVANTNSSVHRDDILPFYNTAVSKYSILSETTFDRWLYYLTSNSLVVEKDCSLSITETGKAFLKYIIDQRNYDISTKLL